MKKGQNNLARHVYTNVAITFDFVNDSNHQYTDFIIPFYFASERTRKERDINLQDSSMTLALRLHSSQESID